MGKYFFYSLEIGNQKGGAIAKENEIMPLIEHIRRNNFSLLSKEEISKSLYYYILALAKNINNESGKEVYKTLNNMNVDRKTIDTLIDHFIKEKEKSEHKELSLEFVDELKKKVIRDIENTNLT